MVHITITGKVGKDWILLKETNQWMLYVGSEGVHQASISLDSDLAWRIFTKGISKEEARRFVKIHGDQEFGEKVLETVSIIA